jgi:hypothetical protein
VNLKYPIICRGKGVSCFDYYTTHCTHVEPG